MSKKKIIKYSILVFAILILLIILLVSLGNIKDIINVFQNHFKIGWFLLCILLILLYAFTYKLSLIILVKRKYKHLKFRDLYFISGSEFFFNAITPFSTGGQPYQVYALKQKNVSISDSTSQLLINFVAYQVSLNIVSIICVILYFNKLYTQIDNFIVFLVLGFSINIFIMILLILIGTSKKFGNALIKLISWICNLKLIKKFTKGDTSGIEKYVNDMQSAFKEMSKSLHVWLICLLTKILANVIYYSIPFVGFMVIGVTIDATNFMYCFALTSFCLTTTIWVPLPGASGGAELVFLILFKTLIPVNSSGINDATGMNADTIAQSGMLVWRFFTYYFMIFYGLFDYLMFDLFDSKSIKQNEIIADSIETNSIENDTIEENSNFKENN